MILAASFSMLINKQINKCCDIILALQFLNKSTETYTTGYGDTVRV